MDVIKERLYTEELTIKETRFWDLCVQKLLRNFTSMKFLIFIFIYWASVWGLVNGKVSDAVFASIVISGLVVIAYSKVYTDTRLNYKDDEYEEIGEDIHSTHRDNQDQSDNYSEDYRRDV